MLHPLEVFPENRISQEMRSLKWRLLGTAYILPPFLLFLWMGLVGDGP